MRSSSSVEFLLAQNSHSSVAFISLYSMRSLICNFGVQCMQLWIRVQAFDVSDIFGFMKMTSISVRSLLFQPSQICV